MFKTNFDKRIYNVYTFIALYVVFLLIYKLVIINSLLGYEDVYLVSFYSLYTFIIIMNFGLPRERKTPQYRKAIFIVTYEIIVFLILLFGLGLFVGYSINSLSFALTKVIPNFIFPLLSIVGLELVRYSIIHSLKDNSKIVVIVTILFIVYEILKSINRFSFNSAEGLFLFTSLSLTPVVVKNILLTFLSQNVGYKPCLIYRVLFEYSFIILPIMTTLNVYLLCVVNILVPLIIYYSVTQVYVTPNDEEDEEKTKVSRIKDITLKIFDGACSVVLIALLIIISGVFNTSLVSIASNSMSPKLNRGDAVIAVKYEKQSDVKKGDIIVFKDKRGRKVVHRVNNVLDDVYYTKGDANNAIDSDPVKYDVIEGKVIFKVPLIGYPAVIFSERK